jgi:hypothetical protein
MLRLSIRGKGAEGIALDGSVCLTDSLLQAPDSNSVLTSQRQGKLYGL